MRINEVAGLSGVTPKEVLEQVELNRESLIARGFKINKRLTASSSLDPEVAAEVVAGFDRARQSASATEQVAEDRRKAEEAERRRLAETRRRQQIEEEEKRKAEERRKVADLELARRQEEIARQAAQRRAAAPTAPAAAAPPPAAAPAPAAPPVAPAPPPPAAAAPAPAPAQPIPTVVTSMVPPPAQLVSRIAPASPAPATEAPKETAPPPAASTPSANVLPAASAPPREARPSGPVPPMVRNPRPQQSYDSPRREGGMPPRRDGDSRPPRDGDRRPPREGGDGRPPRPVGPDTRPPFNRDNRGGADRPPYNRDQRGPGGPRPPREGDSRPPFNREGRGGPGGGPGGPRPPRPAGAQDRPFSRDGRDGRDGGRGPGGSGGPGGPRGPREGGTGGMRPGGPRSFGGGATDTGVSESEAETRTRRSGDRRRDKEKDRDSSVRDFIDKGLGTDLKENYGRSRTPGGRPASSPGGAARKKSSPGADKRIRPSQIFRVVEGAETGGLRGGRGPSKGRKQRQSQSAPSQDRPAPRPRLVSLHGDFTVADFATKCGIEPSEVIKKLFMMGELLTMNQVLDPDLAELMASEFEVKIEVHREGDSFDIEEFVTKDEDAALLVPRPPVVTVMGHVDHGKTTLLDRIRKANVAAGEAGGMTQHIGAYHVTTSKGDIIFLDTPGHEAFTAMRARGAQVTDLVILVVAANDGVMPQTVEAINHAKAAGVPIVVAINKIDSPGADQMRVKQELMVHGLVPEEYGGEIIMAPVSALNGTGVEEFLEMVALQAEVLELKANPEANAEGAIIESRIDPARGAVATVLIRRGTLRIGDVFLCGTETGRIRAMLNDAGRPVEEAGPSMPVEILGISGSPGAGEHFIVMEEESIAREIADRRSRRRRARGAQSKAHITLENLAEHIAEGETKTFNVIIKADVQGSVEAIRGSLLKIKSNKVAIRILHAAVGGVGVSDIQLADASDAVILGFSVRPDPEASSLAEHLGVDVRMYNIIFNLIADVEKAMLGMLEAVFEEKEEGRAIVQVPFKVSKVGTIAGSMVQSGTIGRDHQARLVRDGVVIWRGKISSLRRVKDDVKSVIMGLECGIGLEKFNDIKSGDIIETFTLAEKEASLMHEG